MTKTSKKITSSSSQWLWYERIVFRFKQNTEAVNLDELIPVFWKYRLMFWWQGKIQEIPFEANYPISIPICYTLGLNWATISHHYSRQHIWLALTGAVPIRQAWWSQKEGWEGRWDQGDVLWMSKNHALEGQLRPQFERDRLTQPDPLHAHSLYSTSSQSSDTVGSLGSSMTLGTGPSITDKYMWK